MTRSVRKIKLCNFRRFDEVEVNFNADMNILIGDNESGKSTLLQGLDIVLSGSRGKVETLGLENLMNTSVVQQYLDGTKSYNDLPEMWVEVYLNGLSDPNLNGKNNSDTFECDGLKLHCKPIDAFSSTIVEILSAPEPNFPFEFYSITFNTFSGDPYSGFNRYTKHLLLDSSQINNDYATREYVKGMYSANVNELERGTHQNEYRKLKNRFSSEALSDVNERLKNYKFAVVTNTKSNLHTDLTITENEISIVNRGRGRQSVIKTEFALQQGSVGEPLEILLLEEPENHLSHLNMAKLVGDIADVVGQQLVVTTHNSLICSRLDLRKAIVLGEAAGEPATLDQLSDETARFFMKAPNNKVLEFVLSRRVLLVEGDAEYILVHAFFENSTGQKLAQSGVHVISVGGTSFKRYLDLAKLLGNRVAVVRDNDGNYESKCVENYSDYAEPNITIHAEKNDELNTFERCVYSTNQAICDEVFTTPHIKLSPEDYMLSNKAEAAFRLLDRKGAELVTPDYIYKAIQWVSE